MRGDGMAKTMEARYNGTCRSCRLAIAAGSMIVYGGKGDVRHVDCGSVVDEPRGWKPGDTGTRYGASSARVVTTRFAGGGTSYRNSRGRCEDAPCCGCCS